MRVVSDAGPKGMGAAGRESGTVCVVCQKVFIPHMQLLASETACACRPFRFHPLWPS